MLKAMAAAAADMTTCYFLSCWIRCLPAFEHHVKAHVLICSLCMMS